MTTLTRNPVIKEKDAMPVDYKELLEVLTEVKKGNFSVRMPVGQDGMQGKVCDTLNEIIDFNEKMVSEFVKASKIIGEQGKLTERISISNAEGSWQSSADALNSLISNLVNPTIEIAQVISSVAKGDLSKEMPEEINGTALKGEFQRISREVNYMVKQLNLFSREVTRVAREVGSEGKLGGQAKVKGVAGVWKDLTDSVNQMGSNLTAQVRNIADVTTAVAKGDLSKKITVDVKGEILELKNTINTMVDQLNSFASEVTRVALEVGTEGRLGGQAHVKGVAGTWKDLTDSVNQMASNLTGQVRNIAEVTTAVAKGDLSRKITVDVKGEILELKNTINTMVDQLNSFSSEVTRVAREVGSEGNLGGQAKVKGVGGVWKDLTDSVNQMASNLTAQVRNIAEVTTAVANGDLSKKITVSVEGEILELKNTINRMVDQLNSFSSEVTRVAREVGSDGKLGGQAKVKGVAGVWKDLTDSVNQMASNLTSQVRNIAEVTTAVANGDLSKKITVNVDGEILELKNTINTMVDQLNSFASEVTRVALEVGTEGKLGGQAKVRGVGGIWEDLTDSVNQMGSNLTSQVRNIAEVTTAVANGDLSKKITVSVEGEILELKNTINRMVDQLNSFASEVTRVAREVGSDGKLGGQASVPGASGIWKDLTENVNQLAENLTTQVRAISEVASAVTKGDLTPTINVEAKGEVEALKDTINQMIANLKTTTIRNQEQDWLKSNLAKFTKMLQGQKDLNTVTRRILSELADIVSVQHGRIYVLKQDENITEAKLKLVASYAYKKQKNDSHELALGEGLLGQCAIEKKRILLTDIPGDYIKINSGLGAARPLNLIILPVLFENQIKAVVELASFDHFSKIHLDFLEQLTESIGIVLNTIEANTRTEVLLEQSQSLAEELSRTNEELQDKAVLLAKQKEEVEEKNGEIEDARKSLEEKAKQLTITSKYKSEFLANMSHELRTPLNSLLILAQQLIENPEGNLSTKQINYARTIHSCGDDLIQLINDILDLSKIESGFITLNVLKVHFKEICSFAETTFRPISETKQLKFSIAVENNLPEIMQTDIQRLNQILKNLLSNAFKFTERGEVKLKIFEADSKWDSTTPALQQAERVIAFAISDTGVGIPKDKQHIIFEAFQQAEGSTSRKYGGTGLGLSISRGFAELLGGTIELESELGYGSTFTLYLPLNISPDFNNNINRKAEKEKSKLMINEKGELETGNPEFKDYTPTYTKPPKREEVIVEDLDIVEDLVNEIGDDRNEIQPQDKVLLVVEDDVFSAKIMIEKGHEVGLKVVVANNYGEIFYFVNAFSPIAVTLDLRLPYVSGWKILDLFKNDLNMRHIPVYVISGEESKTEAYSKGARSFLHKPLTIDKLNQLFKDIVEFSSRPVRNLLVVDENKVDSLNIYQMFNEDTYIEVTVAHTAKKALKLWNEKSFDGIVMDYNLPDMTVPDFVQEIRSMNKFYNIPVIVYTNRDFNQKEKSDLKKYINRYIKKEPNSDVNLYEQVVKKLYIPHSVLSESKRKLIENLLVSTDDILKNKKILVVDDDVRNLFALTTVFERYGIDAVTAESGQEALTLLNSDSEIDLVLMDIMMPEMDGYETMQHIRKDSKNSELPIIAVTAKAMKGDRRKCIEAGASDYITKPVKIGHLLSLMRGWLYK